MTDGQSALLSQQQSVALGHCRSAPVTRRTALRPAAAPSAPVCKVLFDPVPRYIVVPGRRSSSCSPGSPSMEALDHGAETGLTDAELLQVKEDNQKRIKRIVAAVGIALTVISIVLVALSLSLGQKIDELGECPSTSVSFSSLSSVSGSSVLEQMRESEVANKGRISRVVRHGKVWSSSAATIPCTVAPADPYTWTFVLAACVSVSVSTKRFEDFH
jgi:hypothetical protein